MFPPGHLAFSYLAARPVLGRNANFTELAALTCGTFLPAVSNLALQAFDIFGLHWKWSHSPLILAFLVLLCGLSYALRVPYRHVFLFFVFGVASHLIADYLFDFPLLYFSANTDDVGGWWLYPMKIITIRGPQLEPGWNILPWYLFFEGIVLASSVWRWKRRDLAIYSAIVFLVSLGWFGYLPFLSFKPFV